MLGFSTLDWSQSWLRRRALHYLFYCDAALTPLTSFRFHVDNTKVKKSQMFSSLKSSPLPTRQIFFDSRYSEKPRAKRTEWRGFTEGESQSCSEMTAYMTSVLNSIKWGAVGGVSLPALGSTTTGPAPRQSHGSLFINILCFPKRRNALVVLSHFSSLSQIFSFRMIIRKQKLISN